MSSSIIDFWLKVNGVTLPTPVECPISEYDMQSADSGRDEAANMHIDQIRANLKDCDIEWQDLTPAEAKLIRTTTAPISFTVAVHFLGETVYYRAYKGDRKWTPRISTDAHGGRVEKWDLSMQLIAM